MKYVQGPLDHPTRMERCAEFEQNFLDELVNRQVRGESVPVQAAVSRVGQVLVLYLTKLALPSANAPHPKFHAIPKLTRVW